MEPIVRERTVDYLAGLLAERTDRRFCEELLSETFCIDFTALHDRIFEVLSSDCPYKLVLAPRSIGKTSLVRAVILKAILFKLKRFIVYVGNSATLAEMQTENVKFELLNNKFIFKAFGNVRDNVVDADLTDLGGVDLDESFSKKTWVAYGRTLVLPRGCGQQIRGLNWRGFRPDLLILDDPENRKEIRNEDNRTENKRWFFGDVMQAVDKTRRHDVIYIDTLKHEDALPISLMEMGGWEFDKLAICDEKFHSYAPAFMSDEDIKIMIEQYTRTGDLDVFYQEYMNIPTAPTTASFKREYFKYFKEGDRDINWTAVETVIIVDPAKTVTPQSDWTGIVAVSLDYTNHKILIRESLGDHFYPDDTVAKAIKLADKYGTKVIGVEETTLHEYVRYNFNSYVMRTGRTDIQFVWLKAIGHKTELRIPALMPLYRKGLIYHNKDNCRDLETQLMSFPHSRRDDIMDAEAYLIQMLSIGERFFFGTEDPQDGEIITPAKAAAKAAKEKGDDLTEEELLELEYENLDDEPALDFTMHDDILTGDIYSVRNW